MLEDERRLSCPISSPKSWRLKSVLRIGHTSLPYAGAGRRCSVANVVRLLADTQRCRLHTRVPVPTARFRSDIFKYMVNNWKGRFSFVLCHAVTLAAVNLFVGRVESESSCTHTTVQDAHTHHHTRCEACILYSVSQTGGTGVQAYHRGQRRAPQAQAAQGHARLPAGGDGGAQACVCGHRGRL